MKNNMKRLLAATLAATTLLGTALPTMADTTTSYPNITACPNPLETGSTATFTHVFNNSEEGYFEFDVWGAAADWTSVGYMSATEAEDVSWTVLDGSVSGVSVYGEAMKANKNDATWYSAGVVMVEQDAEPGLAVVEAKNSQGGYTDFTVIVNSGDDIESVTGIHNVFYDASGSTEKKIADATCASVSGNGFYGNSNYPTPLDCFTALMQTENSKIDMYSASQSSYGSYTLDYVTIDGTKYISYMDWGQPSWQYRVYDATGAMKDFSEIVGMDDLNLESGDTVLWKYGTYGITFPNTFH